jgi:hypothetical protein
MYVNAKPVYTFRNPIVKGLPEDEEIHYTNLSVSLKLFVLLLAANFIYFTGVGSNSRRILKSTVGWPAIVVLALAALTSHALVAPPLSSSYFHAYFDGSRLQVPRDLQLESDSDRSRFGTWSNAANDLIPGNVVHTHHLGDDDHYHHHRNHQYQPSSTVVVSVTIKFDSDLVLLDIFTFFLYGKCKEKICMEIPMEWRTSCGVKKTVHEPTTWGKSTAGGCTEECRFYSAHVQHDDMFAADDPDWMERLSQTSPYALEAKLKLTERINSTCITGAQIERVRGANGWTKFHQTEYISSFLKEQKMEGARPVDTPMDPGSAKVLMQPPQDEFTKDSIEFYQAIVGVLIWLCHCRPDLDFAVNLASRFLRCAASQKHIDLICTGRIFQYPHGTRDYGLVSDEEDWIPTGCSDADLTGDIKSARSTLSFNTRLGRFGCISSFLERKICTSTGQAENYTCVRLCREVIWERGILREMGFPQLMPTCRILLTIKEFRLRVKFLPITRWQSIIVTF